jgi:hypothetical protein
MREFVRPAVRLSVAWLLASMAIGSNSGALAQAQQQKAPTQVASPQLPPVKQIALTEKQIKGLLAASKDVDAITSSAAEDIDKLSPETTAKLDAVARSNGLASYDEYNSVSENIGLVLGGFDPLTRKYVGKGALVKKEMARVRADKKMSADNKKEALQNFKDQLQLPLAHVKNRRNIDLVATYYDQIVPTIREGE